MRYSDLEPGDTIVSHERVYVVLNKTHFLDLEDGHACTRIEWFLMHDSSSHDFAPMRMISNVDDDLPIKDYEVFKCVEGK